MDKETKKENEQEEKVKDDLDTAVSDTEEKESEESKDTSEEPPEEDSDKKDLGVLGRVGKEEDVYQWWDRFERVADEDCGCDSNIDSFNGCWSEWYTVTTYNPEDN